MTYMYVHLHVYVHTYIHVTAAGDVLWVCVQWADDRVWWQCWSGFFLEHHQHPHCMYIHVHVYTYIYKHTYSERTHLSFTVHMCRCVIVLCCSLQGIKNVVRELRIVGLRYMYMYHYTTWYTKSQHYSTICRSNKDSQPDWQFELTHNFTHIKHQNSTKTQIIYEIFVSVRPNETLSRIYSIRIHGTLHVHSVCILFMKYHGVCIILYVRIYMYVLYYYEVTWYVHVYIIQGPGRL